MIYTTLMETQVLAQHLNERDWRIFDCRFVLADPLAGEHRYREAHIPGAYYLHLERDLAGPITPASGRHPLPVPGILAGKLAAAGVTRETQVVAYDDAGGAFAARLWWLMRWLGHRRIAVLDGGFPKWVEEGRPTALAMPARMGGNLFAAQPDAGLWVTSDTVLASLGRQASGKLIDARARGRFQGEEEPIDPVAGHVPGAVNAPYMENVTQEGVFRSPALLRQRFKAVLADTPPAQAVCMCGSGVTACHNLLAMEVAGLTGARLYAGSWSEWIRDPVRPVVKGAE